MISSMNNRMGKKILIPVLGGNISYYIAAWKRQGVEPVVVHDTKDIDIMADSTGAGCPPADAILLPGGEDVDPVRYGEDLHGAGTPNDELDTLQISWLDAFVKAGKPVFGICRGMQVINVYYGGTLIQNLQNRDTHAKRSLAEPDKYHDAVIAGKRTGSAGLGAGDNPAYLESADGNWKYSGYANGDLGDPDGVNGNARDPGCANYNQENLGYANWLYKIFGKKQIHINSSHHEAVDRLGDGLIADLWSTAPDDTVKVLEAMHHESLPVWAVQFHPERCNPEFPEPGLVDGDAIFRFWAEQMI